MASSPARRLLQTNSAQYPTLPAAEPPGSPPAIDSDVVVILAALLCALICVVGLAAVTRCARSRSRSRSRTAAAAAPSESTRGLREKALRALPSVAYEDAVAGDGEAKQVVLAECAICLSEFAPREEVRVLPQCGHAFHVACIDAWLAAHSSCPSCRRALVVGDAAADQRPPQPRRCRKCEAAMDEASSSSGSGGDTAAGS